MASNTPNLGLLKKDPIIDGNDTFNIETMLNENWDKVDEAVGNIEQSIIDIEVPVKSVNNKTGAVNLTASDVGAETPSGAQTKANAAASAALGAANSYTDQEIGGKTIDDTLVPSTDTGLSVKILLSWLANMIKSITGKANWRTKPTKSLEQLNSELGEHKADDVAHGVASKAEAEAGISNVKYMTALRVKEAILKINDGIVNIYDYGLQVGHNLVKTLTRVSGDSQIIESDFKIVNGIYQCHLRLNSPGPCNITVSLISTTPIDVTNLDYLKFIVGKTGRTGTTFKTKMYLTTDGNSQYGGNYILMNDLGSHTSTTGENLTDTILNISAITGDVYFRLDIEYIFTSSNYSYSVGPYFSNISFHTKNPIE